MAAIAGKGYEFFAREIRENCRLGGALRIDHVMRLFHLYCIPEGKRAREGAYVSQPYEDLLKILLLESVRNEVVIIGEDLGTVPDYIRNRLNEANIFSYRLLYFQKDANQDFIDPMKYPDYALVAISTHDLPTLAGFWGCKDIQLRDELDMFENDKAVAVASQERLEDKRKLLQLARAKGFNCSDDEGAECNELSGDIHNALVGLLAMTPCKLLVLSQEDLFKEERQQNVPGTIEAYPNWSIKMKYTVEELKTHPDAIGYSRMFRSWIENSGRAG
jgi:4-alpha-glucanotransferase